MAQVGTRALRRTLPDPARPADARSAGPISGGATPAAFCGSRSAAALCAEAGDPTAPIHALIVGPGGSGKTALLDRLARTYAAAGLRVCTDPGALGTPGASDVAILLDDARIAPDQTLTHLLRHLEAGGRHVVVATRPGPHRPDLDAVAAALGRHRAPVMLGPLGPAEVSARIDTLQGRGGAARPGLTEFTHAQTGGNAKLVDVLVTALREANLIPDRPAAGWAPARIPTTVIEQMRLDLAPLGPPALTLLQALTVGAELDPDLLGQMLQADPEPIEAAVEVVRASGYLTESGTLIPLARLAMLALSPPTRLQALRSRMARVARTRGGPMLADARALAGTGATGQDVAAVLVSGASEAEAIDPALAVTLYGEAVRAGAPVLTVAARLARATALTGDLDNALRLADRAVADAEAPDRDIAVTVAATVLATRGMLGRSAQLYRWYAAQCGHADTLAVPALLGTGDLAAAGAALSAALPGEPATSAEVGTRPPTLSAGAEMLLAEGLMETITGSPSAALSKLARAAALLEPTAASSLMPDTPAALAAVVALNCGEFEVAGSVLARAAATGLGGAPAASRYRMLQAWTAMQRGEMDSARALLATPGPGGGALEPREELLAAAIEVGLARREGDIGALGGAWARARQAIVRHPVDLFALHALGELAVAAARLNEEAWIAPHLAEAWALLDRLGDPPVWAAPLHWYAVQAASLAERSADAERHVRALDAAGPGYPQAAVLAGAARCWLQVIAGTVDAARVESAARALHGIGHAWDASRLAGQAAVRTADRTVMAALMSCARSLRPATGTAPPSHQAPPPSPGPPAPAEPARVVTAPAAPADGPPAPPSAATGLSDREQEVAALLVTGLTYKEIGERLFISAKTVEHHVARMRQRLGSASRGELFSQLRAALDAS